MYKVAKLYGYITEQCANMKEKTEVVNILV